MSDLLNLQIKGVLSLTDYRLYNMTHTKFNKPIIQFLFYFVLFTGSVIITMIIGGSEPKDAIGVGLITIGIILSLVVVLISSLIRTISIKKTFESDILLQKEYTYSFDGDGLTISYDLSSSKIKWREIYDVKNSNRLFVLYISKNKAIVIPKRFFNSIDEINRMEGILKNSLSLKQYNHR